MLKTMTGILALLALLAGCASLEPSSRDTQGVSIQSTPGMAVIYLMRSNPDLSYVPAQVNLNGNLLGVTHAGTYYRVEVPAGRHQFSGFGVDPGKISIDTQAGRVYFVQQHVAGYWRSPTSYSSSYRQIDEAKARAVMVGASRMG